MLTASVNAAATQLHHGGTCRTTPLGHARAKDNTLVTSPQRHQGSKTMTMSTTNLDKPTGAGGACLGRGATRTDRGPSRRSRSIAKRALVLIVVLVPALSLAACGQSAQDKAKNQVCSARSDIDKQLTYLKGLTLATATTTGIQNSLKAIGSDLTKIKDAQPQLNAERKQQVQSANQAFRAQLESVVGNIGQNLSISNAQAQLKSAVQQLGQSYQQTFATINCG